MIAPEARPHEHDRHRDLRLGGGREGDEPGVGVLRVRRVRAQLGGAGLARDLHAGDRRGGPGAGAHDPEHHLAHLPGDARADHAPAQHLVVAHDARARPAPALGDRRPHHRHLQRRRQVAVLADGACADREAVGQLAGRWDRARLGVGDARSLVEAEGLRHRHQALGAELGPERREDRVARVDEGLRERAAARLAAGVTQPDPRERRGSADREAARRRRDARRQRAGDGDDLERRAGRLRGRDGQPRERQHRPVARAHDRHAAQLVPEGRRGGALQPGTDGRVDGVPPVALDRGDDAVAEAQLRPRRAGQALVVQALEPGAAVVARGRAPGDGGRRRVRREQPAVGAQHLGAGRAREHDPAHLLALAQAGQAQVRRPRDPRRAVLVVDRQRDRAPQRSEDARGHDGGQVEASVASLGDAADANALDRRLALGGPYEACEPGARIG